MLARLLLVPVFLGALGSAGCKKPDASDVSSKKPPAPAVKITTITAVEAPAPMILTLTGMVVADQRSEVTADTQGKVVAVMVERGQRVKMGDAMIRLDVRNAALSAREARANLESARAQKQLAEEECKRAKSLFDKGAITRSEFDRQNTQCTSALQQVSAAEARTEMIAKSVNDGVVRAPFEGEVAERMVSPGEWVVPGRALFTLVDDDPLRIELSVPEIAISKIKEGQVVELVAVARKGVHYTATVTRLGAEIGRTRSLIVEARVDPRPIPDLDETATAAPAAAGSAAQPEPATGSGSAKPVIPPATGSGSAQPVPPPAALEPTTANDRLVPGMFAEAHVTVGHRPLPILPRSAIARRGKTWHVFVVGKGELEERVVQVGPSPEPGKVSIVLGVANGEKVVARVTDEMVDGLKVTE